VLIQTWKLKTRASDSKATPQEWQPALARSLGGSGRCSVDRADQGCAFVAGLLEYDLGAQCPNNDCTPRSVTVNITYKDGRRRSITGLAVIPDGSHTWHGAAARAAVFSWNAATIVYGDNFEIMLKASIGGALLYEQGYRMDARGNFTGPANPQNTLTIERFTDPQESWIRYELAKIFTTPCDAAYHNERLNSPSDIKKNRGVVIRQRQRSWRKVSSRSEP
jgi:hypothetical protein